MQTALVENTQIPEGGRPLLQCGENACKLFGVAEFLETVAVQNQLQVCLALERKRSIILPWSVMMRFMLSVVLFSTEEVK
jgi:hypothetical protein